MQKETMFAGFGGQGILLMGKVLAHAAMEEGFEVSWVPSYGAEMRGGTAYCTVVISDKVIGSPVVKQPVNLVAMNAPSLIKFESSVKKGGFIFINSSLISFESTRLDIEQIKLPVVNIAEKLGTVKAANIVALAAFVAKTNMISIDVLRRCVKKEFHRKPKLIPLNMEAITAGINAVNEY